MALIAAAVALAALALTAIMAASETACDLIGRGRARRLAESGVRGGASFDRLSEKPARLAAASALVAGASFAVVSAAGAWLLQRLLSDVPGWAAIGTAAAVAVLVMFSVGEALPRALAHANPESVGLAAAPVALRIVAVFYPLSRWLSAPWLWMVRLISKENVPRTPWSEGDAERDSEGEESGEADADDEELIEAVEDFTTKIVREVMVPRTDMVCLSDDAAVGDAVALIREAGFSRLPVYHDTLDDIRGVVYAKDLLACLGDGTCAVEISGMLREPLFVPETKPADELLREMRSRSHIAIVADEYGGTAGLVTMEDLLEELVGEIYDEYDPREELVVAGEDGSYLIDGRLPVDDLNDLFGTALDPEADTVGGLFAELAGHIPEVGESTTTEGLRLTVEAREGARILRIRVDPTPTATYQEGETR